MLKILLRTLVILLVAGLVAGGVYLFAVNGGTNLLGISGSREGRQVGAQAGVVFGIGTDAGAANTGFAGVQRPTGGDFGHGDREGGTGFSLIGLTALGMQLGKVALITVVVVGFQVMMRLLKRRHPARVMTA